MATPTLVQTAVNAYGSNQTHGTVTINGTTSGNTIIAYGMACGQASPSFIINDNVNPGNYTADITNGGNGPNGMVIASMAGNLGGNLIVNFQTSTSQQLRFIVQEWANISTCDKTAAGYSASSTSLSSGATAALSEAGELVVGFGSTPLTGTSTFTVGAGFSQDPNQGSYATSVRAVEYLIAAGTTAQTATFTISGNGAQPWNCLCATYNPTGAAGTVLPVGLLIGVGT